MQCLAYNFSMQVLAYTFSCEQKRTVLILCIYIFIIIRFLMCIYFLYIQSALIVYRKQSKNIGAEKRNDENSFVKNKEPV